MNRASVVTLYVIAALALTAGRCAQCGKNSPPANPNAPAESQYIPPEHVVFTPALIDSLVAAGTTYYNYVNSLSQSGGAYPDSAGSAAEIDRLIRRRSGLNGLAEYLYLLEEIKKPENKDWNKTLRARLYADGVDPDSLF